MRETYSPAILASYVTFKELYNEGKYHSPYQILSEFIKYIIVVEHSYTFSLFEMKNRLKDVFGFELPTAVIKTSIKGITEVVKKDNSIDYVVDEQQIARNEEFSEYRKEAEEDNSKLSNMLLEFACEHDSDQYIKKDELVQDFIAYLIDDNSDTKHHDLISKFILAYADDSEIKQSIESIRQGAVLYTGLNYNISETGSLKKNFVLYLDTEILFNIAGYNGDVYQCIANDFISLVRDANKGEKKIKLFYFKEVRNEIERFFSMAETIVEGKMLPNNKPAMKMIINGCESKADVVEKKADFFHNLKEQYGIDEDPIETYYSQSYNQYNLEGKSFESIPNDDDTFDALRYISHINKLRKGRCFQEYTESEYLFITETRRILDVSRNVVEELSLKADNDSLRICGFAQNMSGITNVLWYKLNKGFGRKDYPQNLNAVLKAKIVIARHVSQKISTAFRELKKQYEDGEVTKEILVARMIALRDKNEKPEDVNFETVEEDLNFSLDYFQQYELGVETNRKLLKNQEDYIKQLEWQVNSDRVKADNEIAQLKEIIEEQKNEREILNNKINNQINVIEASMATIQEFQHNEQMRKMKRQLIVNWVKLVVKYVIYVGIACIVAYVTYRSCNYKGWSYGTVLTIIFGFAGIFPFVTGMIKNDYKKMIVSVKDEIK